MSVPPYPKYKPSGVEWLGDVPEHWSGKPLKEVATHNDDVLDERTDPDYELLYVDISSVDGLDGIRIKEAMTFANAPSRARRRVQSGDVIVSTVRTYLRAIAQVRHAEPNLVVSTGFAVVRPRACLFSDFLGYLIPASFFIEMVIARSTGVSYPAINAADLVGIKVPVPPLAEQTQIAAFLDRETGKIDELVAEQRRLIELLKEKRQAVISHAVTRGLNPNAPTKHTGIQWLGNIPEHWEVGAIKYFVLQKNGAIKTGPFGSQLTSAEMQSGSIKVYNQRSVIDCDFESGDNFITDAKFADLAGFEAFPGDLLVTTRGTIGRAEILPDNAERGILHPCLLRLQPDNSRINTVFIKTLIQDSNLMRTQLSYLSNATTIDVIYSNTIASVIVPVPPIEEQGEILKFLDAETAKLDALTAEAERAIELLQERRTALISSAVTGKIDVRNAV
ncbi:MAG TPA: restriction endonuclease subunit S [Pyrinomonadaceae bacterium]|nr:restriction endonuclease subunit S [Pyrinomonadaceae bacterium]